MPKLNKKQQKELANAQDSGFDPVDPGVYPLKLMSVKLSDKEGASGFPYWKVEFSHEDEESGNRRQFMNLSLSPKAAFKMKEFFNAFEVDSDTDTDELCGQVVLAQVGVTTIQQGDRAGEPSNEIKRLMPYDESKLIDDDYEDEEEEEEPF